MVFVFFLPILALGLETGVPEDLGGTACGFP